MITLKVLKSILKVAQVSEKEATISFSVKDEEGNVTLYDVESFAYATNDKGEVCSIRFNLKEE